MVRIAPIEVMRRVVLSQQALYLSSVDAGTKGRSHATRVLHLLLLCCVINQLGSDHFMQRPLPGDPPGTLYALHEYMGLVSFGLVLIFWLWTIVRHGETKIGRLFPWMSASAIRAVITDALAQLAGLLRADPFPKTNGAFASAAHGLGLLTLTGMAATGTIYFFINGAVLAHDAMRLHKLLSNLMWAYLLGHAGVAVLHHLLGQDLIKRMFWIRRGITIARHPDRLEPKV